MKKSSIQRQSGFTLVEIAIVLVIIGLLLGGVLKGTELIENSKVKRAINDINAISTAYNAYVDRYRKIPGDERTVATLTARGGNWATVTQAGNGNGVLAISRTEAFGNTGESDSFWQHLRAAGFLSGNPALTGTDALPVNGFGGFTAVTTAAVFGNPAKLSVCMRGVSGKAMLSIDSQIDDGLPDTGTVRAMVGAAATPTTAAAGLTSYDEGLEYTMCAVL